MRRRSWVVGLAVLAFGAGIPAQVDKASPPKPSRHSIADGIVRSVLERARVRLPVVRTGSPVGAGDGQIGLLVRLDDGSLECVTVLRRGQELPNPNPKAAPVAVEEVEEEPIAEDGAKPKAGGAAAAKAKPGEAAPAAAKDPAKLAAKKAAAAEPRPVTVRVVRKDDEVRILGPGVPARVIARGDGAVDFAAIQAAIAKLRSAKPVPTVAVMSLQGEVRLREWLPVVAEARAAGFGSVLMSGGRPGALGETDGAVIDGAIDTLGWEPTGRAPGPIPELYGQELLIALAGDETWSDVLGVYMRCLRQGMWRLSFVAVDAKGRRHKVPLPVPVDSGR